MNRFLISVLGVLLSQNVFSEIIRPGDEVRPGISLQGQQTIEGELAFAIYSHIKGEESPVEDYCESNNCKRSVLFYMKEVEKLSCSYYYQEDKHYCSLTNLFGGSPVAIESSKLNRKLYKTLITTPLPTGYHVAKPSRPDGYTKTVVGISCTRSLDFEYRCEIQYRQ